jgi:hypothetical protein
MSGEERLELALELRQLYMDMSTTAMTGGGSPTKRLDYAAILMCLLVTCTAAFAAV